MSISTRTHIVTGDRDQVRAALVRAHAAGRLVGVREVAELSGERLHVVAELRELPGRRPTWWPARPGRVAVYGVGGAVGVGVIALVVMAVAALVAVVVGAITAAVAWVTANLAVIVACGIGLALVLGGGAARCAGLHCGGCRR